MAVRQLSLPQPSAQSCQASSGKQRADLLPCGRFQRLLAHLSRPHHPSGLSPAMLLQSTSSPQGLCTCHSLCLERHLSSWHCSLFLTICGDLTPAECCRPPAHHVTPQSLPPSQHTRTDTTHPTPAWLLRRRRHLKSGDLVCLTHGSVTSTWHGTEQCVCMNEGPPKLAATQALSPCRP